ncbi:hypothetical protein BKA56DRAFT_666342 [Ilyonectria sp. MPI-CAGE-AT-0026]|nr:hypothetical protein BKA56DRAFT_666342 [Ilyonectria sp. MPI-CAGE-AT-0026]
MFANTAILALAGLAGLAAAQTPTAGVFQTALPGNGTIVEVTKVYTAYTTVCPSPTSFVFNGHTYDVTTSCTLTITDCPCTVVETHGGPPTQTMGWGSGSTGTPHEQPYICKGDKCPSGSGGSGSGGSGSGSGGSGSGGSGSGGSGSGGSGSGGSGSGSSCSGAGCTSTDTPGVVTAGAGAVKLSLGLAAVLALLAL